MFSLFFFALTDFKIYTSYNQLPDTWNAIAGNDIMLSTSYLGALEAAVPNNITLFYIGIFKDKNLVGIVLAQRVQLYLKDLFRTNSSSLIKAYLKNAISTVLKGNILVVGNLTHTGQHSVGYFKQKVTTTDFITTVLKAVEALNSLIKKESRKTIRLILFKDYFATDEIHNASEVFSVNKFNQVIVQPNMIFNIKNNWNNMNDYVDLLNKKYRIRYRRARKKFGNIKKRELDLNEIKLNSNELHSLYMNVSNQAKFNTFILPEHHFYNLKLKLGTDFRVFGYYLNNTLIGFYTLILNRDILETYFLGYDSEHQYNNQLYLNMLYDMLDFGIVNKFSSIVYARTAMEIKSSVGANAIPMTMYIKHTNGLANSILKTIFNFMKPNQKWVERHPFIK